MIKRISFLRFQRGFTIVEMLLAATILTIVITSSYSIFWQGLRVWKYSRGRGIVEKKAVFALEKMGRDFRQMVRVPELDKENKGTGSAYEFSIPSIVNFYVGKSRYSEYGFIKYQWDRSKKTICRKEISATDLYRKTQSLECRDIASHIQHFKVKYLIHDGVGDGCSWYDAWDENASGMMAVDIEMGLEPLLKGDDAPSARTFHRLVFIPTGEFLTKEKEDTEGTSEAAATAEPSTSPTTTAAVPV